MPGRPAARITDMTAHPLPGILTPGPGSFNVIIGNLPAWRGIPSAAAAGLQAAKQASDTVIKTAEAATVAAAGTPGAPAVYAAEQTAKTTAAAALGSAISSAAAASVTPSGGMPDIHACLTPSPVPPHGPGVVIDGSPTVLINGLPACRMGDTILEPLGPPNKITKGWTSVLIGNASGGAGGAGASGGAVAGADAGGATGPSTAGQGAKSAGSSSAPSKGGGAPGKQGVNTGLGKDVDKLADKSPTLKGNIEKLQKDGWTIKYGPAGGGSYTDKGAKEIVIDSNEKGDAKAVTQTLAHESGHALYTKDPYVSPKGLTRDQYAAANANADLKDEGEATMTNAQVRKEINDAGGPDIGIAGANPDKYQKIADKYPDPKDRDKARQEIGDIFADNEHPSTDPSKTYRQYYEDWHKDQYDKQTKKKP